MAVVLAVIVMLADIGGSLDVEELQYQVLTNTSMQGSYPKETIVDPQTQIIKNP